MYMFIPFSAADKVSDLPTDPAEIIFNGYRLPGVNLLLKEEVDKGWRGLFPMYELSPYYFDKRGSFPTEKCEFWMADPDELHKGWNIAPENPLALNQSKGILSAIGEIIETLSIIVGKDVFLHGIKPGDVFYPLNDGRMHIVVGGSSPGADDFEWVSYIADVRLDPLGSRRRVRTPGFATGYGRYASDEEGLVVAHIVDSTFYLRLPDSDEHVYLLANNGTELFEDVLKLTWNTYIDNSLSNQIGWLNDLKFALFCSEEQRKADKQIEDELNDIDQRLEVYRKRVRDLLIERKWLLARREGDPFIVSDEDLEKAWKAISEHPLFDYAKRSRDGYLHIHTKDVLETDSDGNQRYLGQFIVRLKLYEKPTVWAKVLPHPKQVPHPHISKTGMVCFGNITSLIDTKVVEGDIASVATLVLGWLSEGYEADLADSKLEEWPIADGMGRCPVLDLSTHFEN